MSPTSSPARRAAANRFTVLLATVALAVTGCGSDDDSTVDRGHDSAEAVVMAHVEAGREYDLEADCNLRTPERRAEMAGFDGLDPDGYCAAVTASIVADADQATRDRSRVIYTDPTITPIERPGGSWFEVVSSDGDYVEQVEAIEVDGGWWIGAVESDVHDHDGDHEHDLDPEENLEDGSPPTDLDGDVAGGA